MGLYLVPARPADIGADQPAPATTAAYKDKLKALRTALDTYRTAFGPNDKGSDAGDGPGTQ